MSRQKHFFLIRGLTREAGHWDDFPRILQEKYPHAKISFIDLPGTGENLHVEVPITVSKMASFMRGKFLMNSSPDDEKIIISVSLGGMITTAWMKKYPEDFQKAVIINSSFSDYSIFYKRLKFSALFHLAKVPMLSGKIKEGHIIKIISNHKDRFDQTLNLWHKIAEERPVTLKTTLRQFVAASRFKVGNFIPKKPILILASTKDKMVDVECSRMIAKKWNVPIVEHPTGGHDLSNDDPKWIVQKINEWLNE
jgi:pimeloyl-[acyl-carrier protein] methyl ester esterase